MAQLAHAWTTSSSHLSRCTHYGLLLDTAGSRAYRTVMLDPLAVANSADFRQAVQAWAQSLRTDLNEMSGQSP